MTPRTFAAAAVALAMAIAAACSDSGGDEAGPLPTSSTTATPSQAAVTQVVPSATAAAPTTAAAPVSGTVQFMDGKSLRTVPIAQAVEEASSLVGFAVTQPATFATGADTPVGIQVSQDSARSQTPLKQALLTYSKDGKGPDPAKGEPYLRIIEANQVPNSNVGDQLPNPPPGVQVVKQTEPGRIIYLFQLEDRGVIFEFGGQLPRDDAAVIAMYTSMK
jgi:hypothetical protein